METIRLCLAALALLVVTTSNAVAEWRVTQVRQPAHYATDSKNWKTIRRGMTLPRSSWIRTGPRGRLKLNRGSETMRLRPRTLLAIQKASGSRMTTLRQRRGRIDVSVKKRRRPHMTVRNRYMTAVVKGTTFRVSIRRRSSRLSVRSGLVAVRSRGGQRMDVGRGQYAIAAGSGGLTGTGKRPGVAAKRAVRFYNGSVPDLTESRVAPKSAAPAPAITISGSGTGSNGAPGGGGATVGGGGDD